MELGTVIFRTLLYYFLIIFLYRIMGKREVGQLGIIDLIVSILIAELVAISIDNTDETIWMSVIPIAILTLLQIGMAFLSLKENKIRNFFDGKPTLVINNGKIRFKDMLKQRYNLDDLLTQLREKKYRNIDEVEYAVLETNGTLSIFDKNKEKKEDFPLPLILDGEIEQETLKYINKDENWLLENLNDNLENIFYAFYKEKNVYVIKKKELE